MCIIVSKEKGVNMPSKEILKKCFENNDDGAGLMFVENGKVFIKKGFMNFEDFYKYIKLMGKKYNLKEKAVVMHFRISTAGKIDVGNCHPYPISKKDEYLRKTAISTDLGMVHNGIISVYNTSKGDILNDTQMFIKSCISTLYDYDKQFYKNKSAMDMLKDISGSKLCFLNTNENIFYVGEFIEDGGIFYSNSTYKQKRSYVTNWIPQTTDYGGWLEKKKDVCYEDGLNNNVYIDEIFNAIIDCDTSPKLSIDDFWTLNAYLHNLDIGEEILTSYGKYVICYDYTYAYDDFMNLYSIDFASNSIIELDKNIIII